MFSSSLLDLCKYNRCYAMLYNFRCYGPRMFFPQVDKFSFSYVLMYNSSVFFVRKQSTQLKLVIHLDTQIKKKKSEAQVSSNL